MSSASTADLYNMHVGRTELDQLDLWGETYGGLQQVDLSVVWPVVPRVLFQTLDASGGSFGAVWREVKILREGGRRYMRYLKEAILEERCRECEAVGDGLGSCCQWDGIE